MDHPAADGAVRDLPAAVGAAHQVAAWVEHHLTRLVQTRAAQSVRGKNLLQILFLLLHKLVCRAYILLRYNRWELVLVIVVQANSYEEEDQQETTQQLWV